MTDRGIEAERAGVRAARPPVTWIAVADAGQARVLRFHPGDRTVTVIQEWTSPEGRSRAAAVLGDPALAYRDAGEVSPDRKVDVPRGVERAPEGAAFAKDLAEWLGRAASDGQYGRLVLVAEPKTLGDLRRELPKQAAALVTAEVAKDYVRADPRDIPEFLREVI